MIGTWIILPMLKSGKMQEIPEQIQNTTLQIVAVQEIRWKGYGHIREKDYSLHYSCNTDIIGQFVTGFLVKKEIENPGGSRFSTPVQTGPEAHPPSCTMGTGSFPGVRCCRGVTLTHLILQDLITGIAFGEHKYKCSRLKKQYGEKTLSNVRDYKWSSAFKKGSLSYLGD